MSLVFKHNHLEIHKENNQEKPYSLVFKAFHYIGSPVDKILNTFKTLEEAEKAFLKHLQPTFNKSVDTYLSSIS